MSAWGVAGGGAGMCGGGGGVEVWGGCGVMVEERI